MPAELQATFETKASRRPKGTFLFKLFYLSNLTQNFVKGCWHFSALHIHDLADNASKEGEVVVREVSQFLFQQSKFILERTDQTPYTQDVRDTQYNEDFFDSLKDGDKKICIVCPQGCAVNELEYTCPRGKDFYIQEKESKSRIFTSTVLLSDKDKRLRLPLRSRDEISLEDFNLVKTELRKVNHSFMKIGNYVKIAVKGRDVVMDVSSENIRRKVRLNF